MDESHTARKMETNNMTDRYPTIHITGVKLSLLDKDGLLRAVEEMAQSGRKATIASGNIFSFNLAYKQKWFQDFMNQADVVRLEGDGIRLGARILGHKMPRRIVFADFIWELAEFAAQRGFTLYILGARPGVADKAAARLQGRIPQLRVAGMHHGYFDKTPGSADNEAVIQQINAAKPNILLVGFGMPAQERWLAENRQRLVANVVFTCGALFDYISGDLRRAPHWMNEHGLEWLGRFLMEPRRLWRRYLIGNPTFLWHVLQQRIKGSHR